MSKELPYFRFTVAEWMNGDIQNVSKDSKGVFADICAFYWFKDCSVKLATLKQRFSTAVAEIDILLEEEIIKYNPETDFVDINFLNEQYEALGNLHEARVLAGRKGGYSTARANRQQKASYKDKDNDKEKDKDNKGKNLPDGALNTETLIGEIKTLLKGAKESGYNNWDSFINSLNSSLNTDYRDWDSLLGGTEKDLKSVKLFVESYSFK